MERLTDLAAVALPDAEMPPGFRLTNGAYLPTSRVATLDVESAQLGYEATYEEHLGSAFMEIQVITWTSPKDVQVDSFIHNRILDLHTKSPGGDAGEAVVSRVDDPDGDPIRLVTAARVEGQTLVRAIWHSTNQDSPNGDLALRDQVQTITSNAADRARAVQHGLSISGLDLSLPGRTPDFSSGANFENYLHRPDRYDDSSEPASGFVCGYRRGFTEPWVERGSRRRLVACDLLRFESAEAASRAVARPESLVSEWRMEHRLIPEAPDLHDCVMFARQESSSFWSVVLFAAVDDLVLTADVWGFAQLRSAESLAGRVIRQVRSAQRAGEQRTVIDVPF